MVYEFIRLCSGLEQSLFAFCHMCLLFVLFGHLSLLLRQGITVPVQTISFFCLDLGSNFIEVLISYFNGEIKHVQT